MQYRKKTLKKKLKKNKNFNKNQASFYFDDYLETNKITRSAQKNNLSHDRIYLLFFLFISLILIFSVKIVHISLNNIEILDQENTKKKFTLLRRDIIDRNGSLISRNIKTYHAAVSKLSSCARNSVVKLI